MRTVVHPAAQAALLALALVTTADADPTQITASAGDSRVERFAPGSEGRGAVTSDGDLTPGAPGNTDGSREVYYVDFDSARFTQVTSSARGSSAYRVTEDGDVVIGSQGDLTPGAPGNDDGSFETWFWTRADNRLDQITASPFDTFFQTYFRNGRQAFFVSRGDLTPGDPGNPDGANDVYALNLATDRLRQLTATPDESLTRALDPAGRFVLIQSRGDLTPGAPGNPDHSFDLFLVDLETFATQQITASSGDTRYERWSPDGRWIAMSSDGDLVPGGNADGSREIFAYDVRRGRTLQVTRSAGDSAFAAFGPRSHRVAVHSKEDLVAGGNTDGTQEVYIANLRNGRLKQLTASSGNSYLGAFAPRRRFAAVISDANLTPGAPGNTDNSDELFLVRIGVRKRVPIQVTSGADHTFFVGFDPRGRYVGFDTRSDIIPGRNVDGSREAFVATVRRRPKVTQLTSSAEDSEFGAFLPDGRRSVLHSRGDLDRDGPGNADGSLEVFVADLPR